MTRTPDPAEVRARLAEWLQGLSGVMVEVCDPHPGNPSENIFPVERRDLLAALASATEAPPVAGMGERAMLERFDAHMLAVSHRRPSAKRDELLSELQTIRDGMCRAALTKPTPLEGAGGSIILLRELLHESLYHLRLDDAAKRYHEKAMAALNEPTPPASVSGGVLDALERVRDALLDSQYLAGVTAGWNAAQSDEPEAALARLQAARAGHLAGFKEAKATLAAAPEAATPPMDRDAIAADIARIAGCQVGSERTRKIVDYILAREAATPSAVLAKAIDERLWKVSGSKKPADLIAALNDIEALVRPALAPDKAPSAVGGVDRMREADELARLIFPAAASAWDREVEHGLAKGMSRAGAIDDAYHYTKDFRPEVNWIQCRDRVRKALAALASGETSPERGEG